MKLISEASLSILEHSFETIFFSHASGPADLHIYTVKKRFILFFQILLLLTSVELSGHILTLFFVDLVNQPLSFMYKRQFDFPI